MEPGWLEEIRADLARRQLDLGEVLQRVVDAATEALSADRGTLYLVDHARGEVVSRVAHLPELQEIRLKLGEGVAGWVASEARPLRVPETREDPRFDGRVDTLTGYHTSSMLAAPVRHHSEGTVIAVIQLLNHARGRFSGEDQVHLLSLCENVAELLALTSLGPQLHASPRHPLHFRFNHIVGESEAMERVYARVERAARTDATVLVRGESGSGKELVARAVHDNSSRRDGPFVAVDCGALPHHLIENELFGHRKGAFTGADRDQEGRVAGAAGGTLFLDEVAEIPLEVQPKLLRLLQERSYFPVGGSQPRRADVRFVCATHRDLETMVRQGRFRQDLYYRLNVVEIRVPSLRERGSADLDRLIDHFAFRMAERHSRPGIHLTPEARARLHGWRWPGNVRELQNCIESAVVLAPGLVIGPELVDVGGLVERSDESESTELFQAEVGELRRIEQAYVAYVLERCGGNRSEAARILGIGRNTLLRKLRGG